MCSHHSPTHLTVVPSTGTSTAAADSRFVSNLYTCCNKLYKMMSKLLLIIGALFALAFSAEAFAPRPAFFKPVVGSSTELLASRVNAKKEKIKRNRENMRKFASPGRRGTSRRKTLKKVLSNRARQTENEFIAKCFITGPAPNDGSEA